MRKNVESLTELLNKVPHLKQLNHDNQEYQNWRDEIFITLEALFTKKSMEYNRFFVGIRSYGPSESEDEKQKKYLFRLNLDESNLKSIIKMQEKKEEINKALRFHRLSRLIKELFILKPWQWIKTHLSLAIIIGILALIIALLGTNWEIVEDNLFKIIP